MDISPQKAMLFWQLWWCVSYANRYEISCEEQMAANMFRRRVLCKDNVHGRSVARNVPSYDILLVLFSDTITTVVLVMTG